MNCKNLLKLCHAMLFILMLIYNSAYIINIKNNHCTFVYLLIVIRYQLRAVNACQLQQKYYWSFNCKSNFAQEILMIPASQIPLRQQMNLLISKWVQIIKH